ncbi:predicted protein [Naegleria gruberi]|uniref:Predicted protein n=1 Tax=Naegleria gruberi TaxID=5762 RepID=D2VLL8_NAEGR|nr:uncharacterized protein NAEGRDRAFT_69827 [Naegleria gruberi]EFC42412.1 predicted protein [Naegleria gruberi]|eukprot:XP_002675156.1 predicted protein [Naegleria gruberi strain NEG-M]
MATRVMSAANNSATNNSTINNGNLVNSFPSYMPPLNNNNNYSMPSQHPYLEHGGAQIDHTMESMMMNGLVTKQSLMDIYSRNQAILSQHHNSKQNMMLPSYYHDSNLPDQHFYHNNPQQHSNPQQAFQQHPHQGFFSPEHVDGMVSILKGEEDFIHLLDNSEPLTSFDIEDHHSFNPTIVATSPQRQSRKNRTVSNRKHAEEEDDDFDHLTEDEQDQQHDVKSPSHSSGNSSNGQKQRGHANVNTTPTGDKSSTRTSSPTNSQEKNSPYPNGRKRASKACVECQKRHTRCGFERPCERCVRLGLECVEMKSTKKRGRSTMGSNQDIESNNTSVALDKNGKSGKKTKAKTSAESKKRKSSPNEAEQNFETKPKLSKVEIMTSSDIAHAPTTPSIITTLTSTSTNVYPVNDATTPSQLVEKPLGVVAVGSDFTSVQYVSDPLSTMFEEQPLTRLDSIMGPDFIQTQLNLLCEAKATRETIISHVDNGLAVLQQSHLRAERTARAMIKLKEGKLAEMSIKFVFMYTPANPSILESAYVFLNWNGSYTC